MRLSACMRRAAALLVPILLAAAQQDALARSQEANLSPVVSLATTTVENPPAAVRGNMLLASDGNIYLASSAGGTERRGTIARIAPDNTLTVVRSLEGDNGNTPYAGLMQATDGHLYGTAYTGGEKGGGTIFRVTLGGEFTVLRHLGQNRADAVLPYTGLVQAADGHLYGTTLRGGVNDKGTIFRITLAGEFTIIHSFAGNDGENPEGTLVVGADGLYGTTLQGGSSNRGTIYRVATAGGVTTLYSFPSLSEFNNTGQAVNATGANPRAGLFLAADGNFYGTAYQGGVNGWGTFFRVTPAGALTVMHSFSGPLSGGAMPLASVAQDAAGNFYGTTEQGGALNYGTAWRFSAAGQFSILHSFIYSTNDGARPYAAPLIVGNQVYGVSFDDQLFNSGAIFKLDQGSGGTLPVEISTSPSHITIGQSSTLTWSSPTASTCTPTGAWSEAVATSGTLAVTPANVGIFTYVLTCTDASSVVRSGYTQLVVQAPPAEEVDAGGGGGTLSIPALLLLGALALRRKKF